MKNLVERFIDLREASDLAAQMVDIVIRTYADNLCSETQKDPDIKGFLDKFRKFTKLDFDDEELYELARNIFFEEIRRAK